jgi:hypothetical protein
VDAIEPQREGASSLRRCESSTKEPMMTFAALTQRQSCSFIDAQWHIGKRIPSLAQRLPAYR